jgi:hypothetical protein
MATDEQIRTGLAAYAGRFAPAVSIVAKVGSVNESDCSCVLFDLDDEAQKYPINNVRLRPITGTNKGFLQVPKVGSIVLAVRVEDTEDFTVISCSEIDKIQVLAAEESIAEIVSDFISAIKKMKFTTNTGSTINLINIQEFIDIENRIKTFLK